MREREVTFYMDNEISFIVSKLKLRHLPGGTSYQKAGDAGRWPSGYKSRILVSK